MSRLKQGLPCKNPATTGFGLLILIRLVKSFFLRFVNEPCKWVQRQSLEQLLGVFELLELTSVFQGHCLRELATLAITGDKFIQDQATPFDSVDRKQKINSMDQLRPRIGCHERGNQPFCPLSRYRELRLPEKITNQLGGIIPTRIFKIDKSELAISFKQGIMKTKIGRRKTTLRLRQLFRQRMHTVGGTDVFLEGLPSRPQRFLQPVLEFCVEYFMYYELF